MPLEASAALGSSFSESREMWPTGMNVLLRLGMRGLPPNEAAVSDMGMDSAGQALVWIESLVVIKGSDSERTLMRGVSCLSRDSSKRGLTTHCRTILPARCKTRHPSTACLFQPQAMRCWYSLSTCSGESGSHGMRTI